MSLWLEVNSAAGEKRQQAEQTAQRGLRRHRQVQNSQTRAVDLVSRKRLKNLNPYSSTGGRE